jgi:hypothetical protein
MNQYVAQHRMAGVPAYDPDTEYVRQGWEDCRCDRPYCKDFDVWDSKAQANHEAGRRAAACLKAHITLPHWSADVSLPQLLPYVPDAAAAALRAENAFTVGQKS